MIILKIRIHGNLKSDRIRLTKMGLDNYTKGDYDKSLENYYEALNIAEQLGDNNSMATFLINIGKIYADRIDYNRALEKYGDALLIYQKLGLKNEEKSIQQIIDDLRKH